MRPAPSKALFLGRPVSGPGIQVGGRGKAACGVWGEGQGRGGKEGGQAASLPSLPRDREMERREASIFLSQPTKLSSCPKIIHPSPGAGEKAGRRWQA